MSNEFEFKDFTEGSDVKDDLTNKSSLLNEPEYVDSIAFDQQFEDVSDVKVAFADSVVDRTKQSYRDTRSSALTSDAIVTPTAYTTGEVVNATNTPQAVYLDTSTGSIFLTDADDSTKIAFLGFVTKGQNVPSGGIAYVATQETTQIDGFSGLTAGQELYLSGTAGAISSTQGTFIVRVAQAVDATTVAIKTRDATKFGGTGANGALTITSGTTTLDLANADFYERNYTTISITGTGALAFSNPGTNGTIITLKTTGDVTLTSSATPMVNASSLGAAGGALVANADGNDGSIGLSTVVNTSAGDNGLRGSGATGGAGGAATTAVSFVLSTIGKVIRVACGAGGGSGASTKAQNSGAGGRGGGALIIECGGALNFTTASGISVAGAVGGNAVLPSADNSGIGGGGGGAGGTCAILYRALTANTGTITVTGGNGGNGSDGNDSGGGANRGGDGGGSGGADRFAGGAGGGGGNGGSGGSAGSTGGGTGGGTGGTGGATAANYGGGGGGGGGSAGNSYVQSNTDFS